MILKTILLPDQKNLLDCLLLQSLKFFNLLSPELIQTIQERWGHSPSSQISHHQVGGGCINQCYRISLGRKQAFLKINSAKKFPQLFQKEKFALQSLGSHGVIKVPEVINCFEACDQQLLMLEWITAGEKTEAFWKRFGQQMAALHHISNHQFGWVEDNYMGSVPQKNQPSFRWTEFFQHCRLQPLSMSCADKQLLTTRDLSDFEKFYLRLNEIFDDEKPALLHGDLWSGNFICNQNSEPVLIDPATYFGHRSVDLGMTTLFGGFRPAFYEAYHYHYPLPPQHQQQWAAANLYPLLIHLLLFGTSYLPQIRQTLHQFV